MRPNLKMTEDRAWYLVLAGVAVGIAVMLAVVVPAVRQRFFTRDYVWERVVTTGVWRVGLDPSFPPFEDLTDAGEVVGFDVDLARAIARTWGVRVELVSLGYDGLIDAVRTGKVDAAISAIPYDPLLTRDVRFSDPYFDAGWRLVVLRESSLRQVEEVAGARVAVEWGSEGDVWARRLRRQYPGMALVLKPSLDEALAALLSGEVDAAILDGVMARQHASQLRVVQALSSEPYVIVIPYEAPRLHAQVNAALNALRNTGELATIEERWFGEK